MKKTFSARRVPRKIVQDEDEPITANSPAGSAQSSAVTALNPPTVVEARKSSNLRTTFRPPIAPEGDEDDAGSGVITPRRSNISRVAIQRNEAKRSSLHASSLSARRLYEDDDPSYTAESLQQLRDSTPSTPLEIIGQNTDKDPGIGEVSQGTQALNLSSKFGSSLARYQQQAANAAIPSAAEILEKKARRARLAKEQAAEEYISLDPDDPDLDNEEDDDPNVTRDERGKLILKPKDKYGMEESRLVRDDEDVLEDFDDFTEDGKVHLGRKAEVEAQRRRRDDMAARIAEAEGEEEDSDSSDSSEKERNAAFEAAQTRHGTYAGNVTSEDSNEHMRPQVPPKISPLPTLDSVLERLRRQLGEMQSNRMQRSKEMESLKREKVRLAEEEVRIQKALRETAEKFQQLRAEKGIAGDNTAAMLAPSGLELTAIQLQERIDASEDEEDPTSSTRGHTGVGFGGTAVGGMSDWPGVTIGRMGMAVGPLSEVDGD